MADLPPLSSFMTGTPTAGAGAGTLPPLSSFMNSNAPANANADTSNTVKIPIVANPSRYDIAMGNVVKNTNGDWVSSKDQPQTFDDSLNNASKIANIMSLGVGKTTGQAIGTLGGLIFEKIKGLFGGQDNSQYYDTSAPSPLQVLGDVAKGISLVGGLAADVPETVMGGVKLGAGLGALSGGGQAAENTSGTPLPTVGDLRKTTIGALTGAGVGGALGGLTTFLGKAISATGDKIQMTAIKPSLADMKDGFSMDTLKQYDLGGSLSDVYNKTQATMDDLTQQLREKLANSNAGIDLTKVYDDTVASVSKNSLKQFGSNTSIQGALDQLQNEVLGANPTGELSIPDAQLVKQAASRMGSWQYGSVDPEATARETVYNAFYNNLKTAIEDNSPAGVKDINAQLSKLISVSNAVIRRIPIAARNSALSLTDMVTATASILNPHALIGLGISLAQKEGSVGNLLTKLGGLIPKVAPEVSALGGGVGGEVASPANSGQQ